MANNFLNLCLRFFQWVVILMLIRSSWTAAESNDKITINSETLLGLVTKGINDLDSKIGLLLTKGETETGRTTAADPMTENRICSLSSRVIELENEIDAFKRFSSSSSASPITPSLASADGIGTGIYDIQSKITALQNALQKQELRATELERHLQQLGHKINLPSPEEEADTEEDSCNIQSIDIKNLRPKSFLQHLKRINFNVFLRKPANASSNYPHNKNHKFEYGVDGNLISYHHSDQESNPWFLVDLEVPHLIWEIQITIRETSRAGGTKIYLANEVNFDYYGKPEVSALPIFGSQIGDSGTTTITFTNPGGMCGRYVVVFREIVKEYLLIKELQGIGYAFR